MSEGTLRALGILAALLQPDGSSARGPRLVGFEEPEHALHPGALAVLLAALREGSAGRQIIVTTHSADLLENKEVSPEELLAVDAFDGVSHLGPVDEAGRTTLRDRLFTGGELLRIGALRSADSALSAQVSDETLFSQGLE
jgi:predicted ATPase